MAGRTSRRLAFADFRPDFHDYADDLEREIVGSCRTVLDVGCGANSPLRPFSARLGYTVGVDSHAPSIERSRAKGIHREYRLMDVRDVHAVFGDASFDGVLLSDVIEHLPASEGLDLLRHAERIARRKVVVFTPNGFLPQDEFDGNLRQEHLSGWTTRRMRDLGYRVTGINGWRPLRTSHGRITWKPEPLWRWVSRFTQPLVARWPEQAFQLLCVKDVGAA
jgi:SAM-dependent methyltransferase